MLCLFQLFVVSLVHIKSKTEVMLAHLQLFAKLLLMNQLADNASDTNDTPWSSMPPIESSNDNEHVNTTNSKECDRSTATNDTVENDISHIKNYIYQSLLNNDGFVYSVGKANRHETDALEPPTPPRTPINALMTGSAGQTIAVSPFNQPPTISVTPVANLMDSSMNNNHQNMFNNNSTNIKLKGDDMQCQDENDGQDDSNDDTGRASNSSGSMRKRKSNSIPDYSVGKSRNSDNAGDIVYSDFDEDDEGKDSSAIVGENYYDCERRSSSESGDDMSSGNNSSKITHQKANSDQFDSFGLNDTSLDSTSTSIMMQQQKGDAFSAAKATQDYFDRTPLVRATLNLNRVKGNAVQKNK